MKKKKAKKPNSTQQATELAGKIKGIILDGSGIRRRIAADAAMPVKYSRHDGVFFDPNWQDCVWNRSELNQLSAGKKFF